MYRVQSLWRTGKCVSRLRRGGADDIANRTKLVNADIQGRGFIVDTRPALRINAVNALVRHAPNVPPEPAATDFQR